MNPALLALIEKLIEYMILDKLSVDPEGDPSSLGYMVEISAIKEEILRMGRNN